MSRRLYPRLLRLCLVLTVLWAPVALGATSTQWVLPGTAIVFGDGLTAPNVAWTLSNRGNGTGQVSDRYDKGAGAQPAVWEMRCWISLTGANVVGSTIEYYIATSDGTQADAGVGTTTTPITSDQRRALTPVGILSVYQAATNTTMSVSFRNVYIPNRFFSLVMWNASGLPTETSTSKHRCTMTPTPVQMQGS